MDAMGAVSFLNETPLMAGRLGKAAKERFGADQDQGVGSFDALMAGLVLPVPVTTPPPQTSSETSTPTLAATDPVTATTMDQTSVSVVEPTNPSTTPDPEADAVTSQVNPIAVNNATNAANPAELLPTAPVTQAEAQSVGAATSTAGISTAGLSAAGEAGEQFLPLLQQIADLNAQMLASANAATPSTQSQVSAAATANQTISPTPNALTSTDQDTGSETAGTISGNQSQTDANPSNTQPIEFKPVDLNTSVQPQPSDAATPSTATGQDAGAAPVDMSVTAQTNFNLDATATQIDPANRPAVLTPQTIPMLAATMIRRFESGARQFMMRLDPPELGQVEVKLTVGTDKKVRAVVSADRPEALADLVRSARELTRALFDAGLDLEENGLTFQMNDPSQGRGQNDARQDQDHSSRKIAGVDITSADANADHTGSKVRSANDPFQRWQRTRIALTA